MKQEYHQILLTAEQFDKLEEAADIMAMDMYFVDTMDQAIEYLADKYIREIGPWFEASIYPDAEKPEHSSP